MNFYQVGTLPSRAHPGEVLVGEFLPIGVLRHLAHPLRRRARGHGNQRGRAALGSTVNFLLAEFPEKALQLEVFGQPPVGESWFNALSRNIEKDGFKAALFLRLAPVLPIPIDAGYVCGLTPLKTWQFALRTLWAL